MLAAMYHSIVESKYRAAAGQNAISSQGPILPVISGMRLKSQFLWFILAGAGCATPNPPGETVVPAQSIIQPAGPKPSLVILLTIDQFRGDYIDRFGSQLNGGIARLARGGAWYSNAHHDHAITETAPGHATLLSGRFPRSTGISTNRAGVEDLTQPLLDNAPEAGASPARFRGTTLVDWVIAADPQSRALSVSMKDRAAILPVGKSRQNVFWYSVDGRFTTSRYYGTELPQWLQKFNSRGLATGSAGKAWTLMRPESQYPEPDSVPVEAFGKNFTFPHVLPSDSALAASEVRVTPWMDDIILALALDGVNALSLGGGAHTDILSVSLSATDLIGHRYGPDSREIHDQLLRVDRAIGTFLDSIYRMRDSTRVLVVLTGDHGVGSIPELNAEKSSPPPARIEIGPAVRPILTRLLAAGLDTSAIFVDAKTVILDRAKFRKARVNADSLLSELRTALRTVPGVARVDRYSDWLKADTLGNSVARRWIHQFRREDHVELVITPTRMSISGPLTASHGAPFDYDSHVPLIFFGTPFRQGRHGEFVRTVDLAPTLAAAFGVTPLERVDGRVLVSALR